MHKMCHPYKMEIKMKTLCKTCTIDGKIVTINKNGNTFRKMTVCNVEKEIAKILKTHPHPNIVEIYNVNEKHIDMEMLTVNEFPNFIFLNECDEFNDDDDYVENIIHTLENVKTHLQKHGIVYMDWKTDNFGTKNGIIKLFDFDCSGLADAHGHWIQKAPMYYNHKKAINATNTKNAFELDDFVFMLFIHEIRNMMHKKSI